MIQWGLASERGGGVAVASRGSGGVIWFLSSVLIKAAGDPADAAIRGLAGSPALTLHPLTFTQATFGNFSQDLF